jgi:vanadium chloroperoxidase
LAVSIQGFSSTPSNPVQQFGFDVGSAILNERSSDDMDGTRHVPHPIDTTTGEPRRENHRSDPTEPAQPLVGEGWGYLRHFSVSGCLPLATHPKVGSLKYDDDHKLVYVKGSAVPPVQKFEHNDRTPDETLIGLFWAYDGAMEIGTPPRLYNQIVQHISVNRGLTTPGKLLLWENIRLFALVNVAMADAGILAWHYKYCFYLWRPILGIREHDVSLGPVTRPRKSIDDLSDPFWVPLGSPRTNEVGPSVKSFTPPFPAYPSGHATFGAAAFEIVRQFYGRKLNQNDSIGFEFVSDELSGTAREANGGRRTRHLRKYDSLLDAMYDNSISRVYLGVHWKFDGLDEDVNDGKDILTKAGNVGGVPLGRNIANDIFNGDIEKGLRKFNNRCPEIGSAADNRCPVKDRGIMVA